MRRSIAVLTSLFIVAVALAAQPPGQYPVMEAIAKKVIQKYQASSCEQLWAEKSKPATPQKVQTEEKAVKLLREDPAMRKAFINLVAPPIANKMFECGMIP